DLSFDDAEKLKVNVEHEQLKPEVREQVEAALDKTLDVWLNGVELALSEFDAIDHLPNRILLCGGGASLSKLDEALETDAWRADLPFTKKPTIQRIQPSEVAGITDVTGQVTDHTFITAMGLLRVGYDTMVGSDGSNGDRLRDTFNRILSS